MVAQVGYSLVGQSGGWVPLCAVCTVHVETESAGFLVEPQNQDQRFVRCLASKPLGQFSPVWPQNRWRRFLPVWPQNRWLGFLSLSLKTGSYSLVILASKSLRLFLGLGLKTKWATVCRLPGVLILGHRSIFEKNFIRLPFTPPPSSSCPLGPSIGIRSSLVTSCL
jgi:hypothetical protein